MKLNLNWTLNTPEERVEFVEKYIEEYGDSLSSQNLNALSEYVLWAVKDADFELESERSPWKGKKKKDVSLDYLKDLMDESGRPIVLNDIEEPGKKVKLEREGVLLTLFGERGSGAGLSERELLGRCAACLKMESGETGFAPLSLSNLSNSSNSSNLSNSPTPFPTHMPPAKSNVMTFNVPAAKRDIAKEWLDLWRRIDKTEFMVQSYEQLRGRRRPDLPIRDELYSRIAVWGFDIEELREEANDWDSTLFLFHKRRLVQLRRDQYVLLDALKGETIRKRSTPFYWSTKKGVVIYPFADPDLIIRDVDDECFETRLQEKIVEGLKRMDRFDEKEEFEAAIDFREPTVIREILKQWEDLEGYAAEEGIEDRELFQTLILYFEYYLERADFSEDLIYILNEKRRGARNKEVKQGLKERFNLDYGENYISTIYTKRVIQAIINEVEQHVKEMEYLLMGRTVFKTCPECFKRLPRNNYYFNKKSGTSDGFYLYCKKCSAKRKKEKKEREENKVIRK